MTTPLWPTDATTRLSRLLIRVSARMVPSSSRAMWLQEWEAELWQLRAQGRGAVELAWFLVGALWHGLYEGWDSRAFGMSGLGRDLRYALRQLRRSPGFTGASLLLLGSSIGASTALFSVLERAVLAEPPFPAADRLVIVDQLFGERVGDMNPAQWSYPRFEAMRRDVSSLEEIAGYSARTMTLTELNEPTIVAVETVTPSVFPMTGVVPALGRVFGPGEADPNEAALVALVSHEFWTSHLGGDPRVEGTRLNLDQLRFEVVGVLPEGFTGLTGDAEIWLPMSALREIQDPSFAEDPWNLHFNVMARLQDGVTLEAANDELNAFGRSLERRFPPPVAASRLHYDVGAIRLAKARQNPLATQAMGALLASVLMVLLITTANLAGLLLARSSRRQREAGLRVSLGARRSQIIRQFMTESLVLAFLGGTVGLVIAYGSLDLIGAWLAETIGTKGGRGLQYFDPGDVGLSWGVAAFAVLLSTLTGLAFGMLPAWQASQTDPNASLRGARGRENAPSITHTGRDGLLVMQVGIAIVLLTGATLMLQNLGALQRFDLGFDRDGLFTAMYSLTATDELSGVEPASFHLGVLDRVRALPGISGATLGEVPQGGPTWRTIVLASEGKPELTAETHTWIRIQPVPDGYFQVMGVPLLQGRGIEATDDENSQPVVVISELAAEELFPDGSPIGRRITLAWPELGGNGARVVGVVPQVTFGSLDQPPERQAYASIRQAARLETGVVVRSEIEPTQLTRMVAGALAELGQGTALTSAMSMDERLVAMTARPRVIALLLSVFGALSAFLVATGLYGTLSYMVTRRTKELGLRISLGADRAGLVILVVRQGFLVTLTGLVLGSLVAAVAGRALEPLMLSPGGADWPAIGIVSLVLLGVAVAAALLPAMRATRVDPMVALRTD